MVATEVAIRLGRAVLRQIDRVVAERRSPTWSRAIQDSGERGPFNFRILHGPPHPSEERAWREFLTRADWPTLCVAPEFFLECCTGEHPFAVLAIEGNKIAAILTGWREGNSIVSGLTCRPHVCFDLANDYARAANALARGLLAEAGSSPLVTVYAWAPMETLQRVGFRVRGLTGTVVLDLRQGPEALFKQLHADRRSNIRHAMKHGIEVFQASREEDLAAYYAVFCRWHETSRKRIYGDQLPFSVFAEGYRRKENRRLFLARHAGQVIAGIVIHFSRGGLLEGQESASLDEYLHSHPNDLLIWKTVEWGCAEGFSRYSMTGAHPFLQRMGGTLIPVYRHRLDRTWLHRHDLREALAESRRITLVRAMVRTALGHRADAMSASLYRRVKRMTRLAS